MRRLLSPVLLCSVALLLGTANARPAAAQQANADDSLPEAQRTNVRFTVEGEVQPATDAPALRLPMGLMGRLGEQDVLAQLQVRASGPRLVRMHARFVFSGMAAFREWYESDAARGLLQDLDEASPDDLKTAVRVRRYPHAQFAEEGGE